MDVDVLIVGDFRFPGGTSTSIASEIRALAGAGYTVGLLSIAGTLLSSWRTFHPEIAEVAKQGLARFVTPRQAVHARLCLLQHPSVFELYPSVPLNVTSDQTVLVAHHPPIDSEGTPQYSCTTISRICSELFGPVTWAPVGPKVRAAFQRLATPPKLTPDDWVNVLDNGHSFAERIGLPGAVPVIGRHSRPDPQKWPDTREAFLGAYPPGTEFRIRLMGYSDRLDTVVGERPANWEVLGFNAMPVPEYLASLDYFSYYHGRTWIEAFGRSILEAMAAGLVCLLPPDFEPLFGDGAVYRSERDVADTVRAFQDDPTHYKRQSEQAICVARERFGPEQAVSRVERRIGPPRASSRVAPAAPRRSERVLYFTSNGVGMGHLTRVLASARRVRPELEPVVVTMSKAFGLVRSEGIMVEYLPYFRSVPIDEAIWHQSLAAEIAEILRFYHPQVFVFDGNVPYRGLLEAMSQFPGMWTLWQRRGMWRPGAGAAHIERETAFDVVVEPGELAAALDRGPTARRRGQAFGVPPIRYLEADEALHRDAARSVIGLDRDRPAILLQFGSGNNFNTREILARILEALSEHAPDRRSQVVFSEWRMSDSVADLPPDVIRLQAFPISRFLNAFDYAVAMAGYNTFHENIAGHLPTLFLSNDNPEQDEQWLRADYGAMRGFCLSARSHDVYAIRRGLAALADPLVREGLRSACRGVPHPNGAGRVAEFIRQLALSRKVDRHSGPHPSA